MASYAGAPALTGKRDVDQAKKLSAEAGYKGEKIVVLDAVGTPNPHAHALVSADLLKRLGLNVEIAASDWGYLVIRRASKKPLPTTAGTSSELAGAGADMLNPMLNQALRTNGEAVWFGWPSDDRLEELRARWLKASDSEARQEIYARRARRPRFCYVAAGQLPTTEKRDGSRNDTSRIRDRHGGSKPRRIWSERSSQSR